MSIAEHLVASARGPERKRLLEPERAEWLWDRMRRGFPNAFANRLMDDHLHLVAQPGGRPRLRRILSAYTARFGVRFDVLEPQPATSRAITSRMMRYAFFNPVRRGLVSDPWQWRWTTLRDLGGAVHPVWTDARAIARRLRTRPRRLLDRLTSTADLSCEVPRLRPGLVADLPAIVDACANALRQSEDATRRTSLGRRLIVQTAYAIGRPDVTRLAADLEVDRTTIWRARRRPAEALDAALLCLGDPRL